MNLVARYDIACPCGETISLLEETLRRIVANLRWSDRANQQLVLLCLRCNTAFHYDYQNRKPAEVIDVPPQTSEPKICFVQTGCGHRHCDSPIELVVLGRSETTHERFEQEVYAFDRSKVLCDSCRQPLPPERGELRFL